MVTPFDDGYPRSLTLTYLLLEQIGKNRRALPDDDALTIAQGIPSVGAVVHISVDGFDPGERRVPATPTACRCTMKMNGRFPACERQLSGRLTDRTGS
jgi:hypothetical protein